MTGKLQSVRGFYRRYLARYAWARWIKVLALWTWSNSRRMWRVIMRRPRYHVQELLHSLSERLQPFSPSAARLARQANKYLGSGFSCFSMLSFAEYCEANEAPTYQLAPAETVTVTMPTVEPDQYQRRLHSGSWSMAVPAVQAIEIPDAEVMGGSDFVFTRTQCLHHGLYKFERDLPAEEMHGMITANKKLNFVARYARAVEPLKVSGAISLVGSTSGNYIHWLTETAPKLALLDEVLSLRELPLIIDANLHPNILESLSRLNSNRRRLIPLLRGRVCKVDKLVAVTPVAYVPFDYRGGFKPESLTIDPTWAMFVPHGVHALKHKLLSACADKKNGGGARIFLRRTSHARRMRNATAVEAALLELGFQIIEPESFSFVEQVKLFSTAAVIVAQAGASLGNIIFAPKACHVVILSAWSPCSIYYYFSNLASILGLRCSYVLCDPDNANHTHPAHQGLNVDVHTLKKVIGT